MLPNICTLVGTLASRTQNIRMCPSHFDNAARERVAHLCCRGITRLLCILDTLCPTALSHTRRETMVVGILYLMQSGLLAHNTYVLPRIPELRELLPLESYLYPYFAIKCKSITEIENLVKMQIRVLSAREVARLGVNSINTRQAIPSI
eukprot:3936105-Rhodomonas_salina.4